MSHLIEEQSCASPASVASTGSFIVSDDESPGMLLIVICSFRGIARNFDKEDPQLINVIKLDALGKTWDPPPPALYQQENFEL